MQVSGYIADTFRADGKMTTTHIRWGAFQGQWLWYSVTNKDKILKCPNDI